MIVDRSLQVLNSVDTFTVVILTSQDFCWCSKLFGVHHSSVLKEGHTTLCNEIYAVLKRLAAFRRPLNCDFPHLSSNFSAPGANI